MKDFDAIYRVRGVEFRVKGCPQNSKPGSEKRSHLFTVKSNQAFEDADKIQRPKNFTIGSVPIEDGDNPFEGYFLVCAILNAMQEMCAPMTRNGFWSLRSERSNRRIILHDPPIRDGVPQGEVSSALKS